MIKKLAFSIVILLAVIMFLFPDKSSSQEMEPRNYSSIPIRMNALALTYAYTNGNIITQGSTPIKDLELTSSTVGIGYLRSFGLFGKLCKLQAAVPFVFLSGTAQYKGNDTAGTRTGFGDSRIKLIMNILGTPALLPKDFMKFKEEFVLGTSIVISVPTGLYYDDKLINLGSNRWGFKPEVGMSYNKGPFFFELFTGIWMFTKNSEYLKTNSVTQDPLFALQFNVSYFFPSKIWFAVNSTYVTGGETKVNGIVQNNLQKNFNLGLTLSVPINNNNSIKANFSSGVATRAGGDFTSLNVTYQYIWF